MPFPVAIAVGSAIGGTVSYFVSNIINTNIGPEFQALTRNQSYKTNKKWLNVLPATGDMIQAYHRGEIEFSDLRSIFAYQGFNLPEDCVDVTGVFRTAVCALVSSKEPVFDPLFARSLKLRELLSDKEYEKHLKLNGISTPEKIKAFNAFHERLSWPEYIVGWQRKAIDDKEFEDRMDQLNILDEQEVKIVEELKKVLPTPSDLITFSVREVWDNDIVKRFGYDDEFPPIFAHWMDRQGLGWNPGPITIGKDTFPGVDWPHAFWRSHWQVISPSQAYTMMHRLRPGEEARWASVAPDAKPFTLDDVGEILKIADYPPAFRDRLAAISFNTLTRVDIRRFHRIGVLKDDEIAAYYLDMGYKPEEAKLNADFTIRSNRIAVSKLTRKITVGKIKDAKITGLITEEQALIQLHKLSIEDPIELQDYTNLAPNDQLGEALTNFTAVATVKSWRVELELARAKKWLTWLHRRYVNGLINDNDVFAAMTAAGILPDRQTDYLEDWRFEKNSVRRDVTAAKILQWGKLGILNINDVTARLLNLGYGNFDIPYMIAEAQYGLALTQARQAKQNAQTAKQQQQAIIQQQNALRAELNRTRAELARHGSVSQLGKWLRNGRISEGDYNTRMSALGWPPEDIERAKAEALGAGQNGSGAANP